LSRPIRTCHVISKQVAALAAAAAYDGYILVVERRPDPYVPRWHLFIQVAALAAAQHK
jgi:hypothetical protein